MRLHYQQTPIIEVENALTKQADLKLFVKREDLNHPHISGNKWWKLKYNVEAALEQGHDNLLTFGGAFSNHIYAVAKAAEELKLNSIGVIRGDKIRPLNPTLEFAEQCGMKLHFVSREEYRKKTEASFIERLHQEFGNFYLIPEGGTNEHAIKGTAEFGKLLNDFGCDYACLPVGTGGTMAGIVQSINKNSEVLGFSVLKPGEFLVNEVERWSGTNAQDANWRIVTDYHFGGYAKTSTVLNNFTTTFKDDTGIPLDFVYTGKMMYGIFDLIAKGFFKRGSRILAVHTGGLQGQSE